MVERRYVPLGGRGVVTVGGPDRKPFLQGLISNDIDRATPDNAIWAALLTPQGKYLHDFFVAEIAGVFHLDCEKDRMMDLGQRLSRHKLRARVDLGIGEDLQITALTGAGAMEALGLPHRAGAAAPLAGGIVFVDPRHEAAGARAILPREDSRAALEGLGFAAGDRTDYDRVRIPLGLPDGSRDLVVEKSILLESNFDELHGVDWQKGCYMGQELTARTKYRGLVKKRLMPVTIDGPAPPPGAIVTLEDREAGEMRSVADGLGLALLRLEIVEQAEREGGILRAGNTVVTPRKPDWARF